MKAYLVLAAAIAFGAAPFVTEGFAGFRPDQFPIPQNNAPVQPAGYAFSIWGVIYLWLLVHAAIGVWKHQNDPAWEPSRLPMIISMGFGAVWIKVATLSVIWATVLIWAMLLSAVWAMLAARKATPLWAAALPIGLYAGWLTAASFVSIGLVGAGYGLWFGQLGWAFLALGAASVFGIAIQNRAPAIWTYAAAIGWAFFGVTAANYQDNYGLCIMLVMAIFAISGTIGRRRLG